MYTFNSRVRYSEVDPNGILSLSSVINYFQDCSTFQSEDLDVGVLALKKSRHAWLLNSWQVVLKKLPSLGDEIRISTWAYDFKGTYGYRNFLMRDTMGKPLAYANSIWIYLDTETGRPSRCSEEVIRTYPIEPAYPMEYAPRKIALPEHFTPLPTFSVPASFIDTNHHVNNCGYIKMATNCLPKDFTFQQMRAEYRKPALLGDMISPSISQTESSCVVALLDTDAIPYAIVEFTKLPSASFDEGKKSGEKTC